MDEKLLQGKRKVFKKLLVGYESTVGVDKIPTQDEFKEALQDDINLNKIFKQAELNQPAYEDLIFSINTNYSVGKAAFTSL